MITLNWMLVVGSLIPEGENKVNGCRAEKFTGIKRGTWDELTLLGEILFPWLASSLALMNETKAGSKSEESENMCSNTLKQLQLIPKLHLVSVV